MMLRLAVCLVLFTTGALAQTLPATLPTGAAPPLYPAKATQDGPALTDLEACRVDGSLLNETIVALKIQLADLQKRHDVLQLQLDRVKQTPPDRDGFTWSWERDPQTGLPKGYIKVEPPKEQK